MIVYDILLVQANPNEEWEVGGTNNFSLSYFYIPTNIPCIQNLLEGTYAGIAHGTLTQSVSLMIQKPVS